MKKRMKRILIMTFGLLLTFGVGIGAMFLFDSHTRSTVLATPNGSISQLQLGDEISKMPINNLTEEDWDYIFTLGKAYMTKSPKATDEEIEEYIRSEIIVLSIEIQTSNSTKGYTMFGKTLTNDEFWLFFWHPIIGSKSFADSLLAKAKTDYFYGDPYAWQTNGDAFRHGYWNALMVRSIGAYWAEQFATAHESEETNLLDKEMDLTNNAIGRTDGTHFGHMTKDQMAYQIVTRVSAGHYVRIVNNNLVQTNSEHLKPQFSPSIVVVTNPQQLTNIRNNPYGYYVLGSSINLSGQWTPIPNFYGVLDGNGYTVSGMNITTIRQRQMAFVGMNYGQICNLVLTNVNIHHGAHHTTEWTNVAGIVGENMPSRSIINCTVRGTIEINRYYGTTGGIVGWNYGRVEGCTFGGPGAVSTIIGNGDLGGIAGTNHSGGVVSWCSTSNAKIRHYLTKANRSTGGIVGYNDAATILDCNVSNSTIENFGQNYSAAPPMGIIVGEIRNNSTVADFWRSNVTFSPGSLSGNTPTTTSAGSGNRVNFGSSIYHHSSQWQWCGRIHGANDISVW